MRRRYDPSRPPPSEITPPERYYNRREIVGSLLAAGAVALGPADGAVAATRLEYTKNPTLSLDLPSNSFEDITTYNNFYEFGTGKSDPAERSSKFKPRPWTVKVSGEAERTGTYELDDLLRPHALEERIYRLRCVEAWSMVVPWVGIPLGALLKRFEPNSRAKYVAFTTVLRPSEMPGQRFPVLDWPYVEGLRIDEAMHPLALLAVGLYGQSLPNQNGAPLRL
ncbi:MAG TPA: protein-methionine-sulfoxide reductase catalytic subunit MsrP, partial [Steroidobacteraceae bacterium]|nr:protein-methionine-sulfoxide reductase catalytic subunit MsrP [Steroidobacteraceae bacterium]